MEFGVSGNGYLTIGAQSHWFWQKDPARKLIDYQEKFLRWATKPLPEDIPKDSVWDTYIEHLNSWIRGLLEELGLRPYKSIVPGQVHFWPKELYQEKFGTGTAATYMAPTGTFYVPAGHSSRFRVMKTLMHETIHYFSYQVFIVDRQTKSRDIYRTGYGASCRQNSKTHFRGLNEGVVDLTVIDLYRRHKQEIIDLLDFSTKELRENVRWTGEYSDVVQEVIRKLARHTHMAEALVWQELKRHQFTGKLMHLRSVNRYFGTDALKILADLGGYVNNPEIQYERAKATLHFFQADSYRARQRYVEQLDSLLRR